MSATALSSPALTDAPAPRSVVRFQSLFCLLLLLLLAAIFLTVDFLARSRSVAAWFNHRHLTAARKTHGIYARYDQYMDKIDYLWMAKLPRADYSRGGVYLFGSSIALCSLEDWALPPNLAALIHNYGYSGSNLADNAQFIRYLIRYNGLLAAGPDKTLVIMGLSYVDYSNSRDARNYFQESILRSGLYNYDPAAGITPVACNRFQRKLKFEEMRCRSFLLGIGGYGDFGGPPVSRRQFRKVNTMRVGKDWPALLSTQLQQEASLLTDLKHAGVHVVGVLLPEGTWNDGIPAHDQFIIRIGQLFADQSLPLIDDSRIVPDSGFTDSVHCSLESEPIIHHALMTVALDFLHHSGALPPASDSPSGN
jgi:hypothetical protein